MRKFLLTFLILGSALAARSQTYGLYQTCTFTNSTGQAINGAQVYFLTQPANTVTLTPLASVYSTNTGGPLTQPLKTDGYGSCTAYLSPGLYTVCFNSPYTGKRCFADQAISLGSSGSVTPGSGRALSAYPLGSAATVGPSNIAVDVTGNKLVFPSGGAITIPGCTGQAVAADGTGCVSAGGAPGGSNLQIQFNNSSAFGGASGVTVDAATQSRVQSIASVPALTPHADIRHPNYGALCNTTSTASPGNDDGPAFQLAINAAMGAGGSGVVYIPDGCYFANASQFTNPVTNKTLTIEMEGTLYETSGSTFVIPRATSLRCNGKGFPGQFASGNASCNIEAVQVRGSIGTAITSVGIITRGTYTSGGSITGTVGQTCNLAFGAGGTATVALTGTNVIASGTALTITSGGAVLAAPPPTGSTLSSGTATCSGSATVVLSPTVGITPTFVTGSIANLTVGSAITMAGNMTCPIASITRTNLPTLTNGSPNIVATLGSAATITQVGVASNVLTVTATNTYTVGQVVKFSNVGTNTFLNALSVTVATASGSQFTASVSHADVTLAADTGTAIGQVGCRIPADAKLVVAGVSDSTFNGTVFSAFSDFTAQTISWRAAGGATTVADGTGTITGVNLDSFETEKIEAVSGNTIFIRTNHTHAAADLFGGVGLATPQAYLAYQLIQGVRVSHAYGAAFWSDGNATMKLLGVSFIGTVYLTSLPMEMSSSWGFTFEHSETFNSAYYTCGAAPFATQCGDLGPPFSVLEDMLPQSIFSENSVGGGWFGATSNIQTGIYITPNGSGTAYENGPILDNMVIEQPWMNGVTFDSRPTVTAIYSTTIRDSLIQDNLFSASNAAWVGMTDAPPTTGQASQTRQGQVLFYNPLNISYGGGPSYKTVNKYFCGQIGVYGMSTFTTFIYPECAEATVNFSDGRSIVGELNTAPVSTTYIPHATRPVVSDASWNCVGAGCTVTKSNSVTAVTYVSGGTVTGTAGTAFCNLAFGTGGTGTILLTGTNSIAGGTVTLTNGGMNPTATPPTTATLTSGAGATCSGTATITTTLNGLTVSDPFGGVNAARITNTAATSSAGVYTFSGPTSAGDVFLIGMWSRGADAVSTGSMAVSTFASAPADTFDIQSTNPYSPLMLNLYWHPTVAKAIVTRGNATTHSITFQLFTLANQTVEYSRPFVIYISASENIPMDEINRWRATMLHGYVPSNLPSGAIHALSPDDKFYWANDTNLYRGAAGVLKTDGVFDALGYKVNGSFGTSGQTLQSTGTGTQWGTPSGLADPGGNGVIKRTALGVTAPAAVADVVSLWTTCTGFLKSDGTCVNGSFGGVTLTEWASGGVKTAGAGMTANGTQLWSFELPNAIVSTKISYTPSTADNTANLYDIGIYSSTGTLLCHVGATAGTSFAPNTSPVTLNWLASCSLSGGTRYLFAETAVTATAVINTGGVTLLAVNRIAPTAGSATTGGVLNGSVTPPADAANVSNGFPQILLW